MTLGVAIQPSYLKDIDTPGDKIVFDDFTLRFLVDEDLKNYMEIHNWIRGLGYPDSLKDIYDLQNQQEYVDMSKSKTMNIYSDGTLTILGSGLTPNFKIKFNDLMAIQFVNVEF
jgi:hypothetical protein